ncbi:hypothetical protein CZ787_18175 [Halomonas citrativorans]|uniref:Uncharacterized protein n=1 Tax=Halomonas citrativorans TaxID=2742612 RepID=A0A1R4I5G2_9GAMM|nr:hypothetical protein CZ787_18175 [Halomonas citrativorans]
MIRHVILLDQMLGLLGIQAIFLITPSANHTARPAIESTERF